MSPSILNCGVQSPFTLHHLSGSPTTPRPHCSFTTPSIPSLPAGPATSRQSAVASRPARSQSVSVVPSMGSVPSGLLARRQSNASNQVRPDFSDLVLPDLPLSVTDEIREEIIGESALADTLRHNEGTPGRGTGLMERVFSNAKGRKPTPYPETKDAWLEDEAEGADDDAGEEDVEAGSEGDEEE